MGVLTYAVWTKKRCADLSKTYGWSFSEPRLAFVYLDNILVASKSESQYRDHLKVIFELLSANGLVVNRSKCAFGVTELEYLAHLVTCDGIRPLTSRIQAIHNFPISQTRTSLQRFLGMINYYYRFLPGIAPKIAPLHAASAGRGKDITWTSQCQNAFEEAKASLSTNTLLHHPRPDVKTSNTVDAPESAIGAQLEQL